MTYLLFGVALSLSAVAAYYAVMGLIAIFAAAIIPIAIMGSLLEASKLVVASWLYRNWKDLPKLMKSYFTASLVILMMLTSMGIFGFLSKAHMDQSIPTGDIQAQLTLIDEKIKTEKENINANRKELSQLDAQVDQTISRTTEASGADRAISIRRGQQKDRNRILKEIGDSQAKVAKYNEERAPIATQVRKVEAEVGPIKYIAALIYGDNPDSDILEKAVRWVIIMIVVVFDPLAVLMLVGANWSLKKEKEIVDTPEQESPIQKSDTESVIVSETINISDDIKTDLVEEEPLEIEETTNHSPDEEWNPELFKRVKKIEYDSAGRRTTPETEEEFEQRNSPEKTKSFLSKVQNTLQNP